MSQCFTGRKNMQSFTAMATELENLDQIKTWDLVRDPNHKINEYIPYYRTERDGRGYYATCLGHALNCKDLDLIRACLKRGADPELGLYWHEDGIVSRRRSPIVYAAGFGGDLAFQVLKELINAGLVPTQDEINKMLHEAVWPLSLECVRWCINNKADPNYQVYPGCPNALMFLCYRWDNYCIRYETPNQNEDYIKAATLIIQGGVDVNAKWSGVHSDKPETWDQHLIRQLYASSEIQQSWIHSGMFHPSDLDDIISRIKMIITSKFEPMT